MQAKPVQVEQVAMGRSTSTTAMPQLSSVEPFVKPSATCVGGTPLGHCHGRETN